MDQSRMKMIRVFQSNSQDQIENIDPLTHFLPPSQVLLAPPAAQIMEKVRDALALVTTIGFSSEFFLLSRRILLLDTFTQEEGPKRHNSAFNQLYLSNKIEIVPMQPIQWIYGEIKLRRQVIQQTFSPIRQNSNQFIEPRVGISLISALLGSVIILLQIKDNFMANQIVNVLKEAYQKIQQMDGCFPKMLIFYNSKNISQNQLKSQLQLLKGFKIQMELIGADECQNWDQQFRLIGKLKLIIQKLRPKVIDKISINARLLILLWSSLANQQELLPTEAWQLAQNIHVQEQSQNALHHYMSRIDELTQGQTLLSCDFFREVQAKVRSDVMKQVTERTGALSQREDIMKTERRLLEIREEIESRNQKAVIEWGKDFLREAWGSVQKKIGKQIKSISSLKQESQIFIDFFRKKSDNYLSLELMTLLVDFLLPKLMDSASNISNSLVISQQDQLKAVQAQMISLSNESKDLRKKLGKEQGEVSRRIIDLKQKNSQLQANYKLLQHALDQSKQETSDLRERLQEKIAKQAEQYENLLKKKQKILEQSIEKAEQNLKANSLLESELNKQKLLHLQTKQFYQQTINTLKEREAEARDQLEQMNLSASREMNILRTSSTKEIDIFQSTNTELQLKISNLEHQILERNQALQKLKTELQFSREQIKDKQNFIIHLNELELRNKVLSQTQSQCQLLRIKLKKCQDDLRRIGKQKQQQIQLSRQYQTKALIAVQKMQHFDLLYQQQRSRSRQVINDIQLLRAEKEELKQNLQYFTRKITVEMGCQVEDTLLKQQLKAALQVIRELEADYKRMTTEYEWQKRLRT